MKAITYTRYGSPEVLQLSDIPTPTPKDDELQIKIHAVSLNGSDKENLVGRPLYARIGGLFKPSNGILGSDIAGVVTAVGGKHSAFKIGDEVFGELLGYHGGLAEYACTTGTALAIKPASLSFEQAAAIPQAGVIAYRGILRTGQVRSGQQVLINGGGGSGGSFAIQLAKLQGAEVTAVDNSYKLDFMRSLGADHVMDYSKENFTRSAKKFDVILDLIAYQNVFAYLRALKPQGSYYVVGGSVSTLLQVVAIGSLSQRLTSKRVRLLAVPQNQQDLLAITKLCEDGQITPTIDRTYALDQAAEAFHYLNSGKARGKLMISL